MYNEYKVEYRVFRNDGNEYQMRKIPLKTNSEDEARQVLIEMRYIKENDKISILKISPVEEYSSYNGNTYPSNNLFFNVGNVLFNNIIGKIIAFIGCVTLFFVIINNFKGSGNGSGVSSVTDANQYLNGKTFIATPRGNVWYKLSFSENSCKLLTGVPQYEGWDVAYSGIYSIQEGRYSDTGQLHYYVKFGNDESLSNCFMFDIKNKSLYVCMNGNSPLAVMEIGDRDPWN